MESVANMASEPNTDGALHIVESPTGHMTLKRLIQNDKERLKQGEKGNIGIYWISSKNICGC